MGKTSFNFKLLIFSRVNYSEDEKCSAEQKLESFNFVFISCPAVAKKSDLYIAFWVSLYG